MKCLNPYIVDSKKINEIHTEQRKYPVPCGQCPECKKQRVQDWTFRLFYEERVAKSCVFVTLTYDTRTVPVNKQGFMTLEPEHLTLFFHKLRRYDKIQYKKSIDYTGMKDYPGIKYYACGEYGEGQEVNGTWRQDRPHYHGIIFNCYDYTSIGKAWNKGSVHIEHEPKSGAFAYTAKYIDKEKRVPFFHGDERVKEFSRMSNNLGKSYLTKEVINWHRSDPINHNYVMFPGEKAKQRLPRYYYEQIFDKKTRKALAEYWEVEALIDEIDKIKKADKLNLSIYQAEDSKSRYIENLFNKTIKKRNKWQNQPPPQPNQ